MKVFALASLAAVISAAESLKEKELKVREKIDHDEALKNHLKIELDKCKEAFHA